MAAAVVNEAVTAYLGYLAEEKHHPDATIISYRLDLHQFVGHLDAVHPGWSWCALNRVHLRGFAAALAARGYATSSIARKQAAVAGFLHWLTGTGVIPTDPTLDWHAPHVAIRRPRVLTPEEVDALLAATLPDRRRTSTVLRDRVLRELLARTGARISEVVGLGVYDVDCLHGVIDFHAADRWVTIEPDLAALVSAYVTTERRDLARYGHSEALLLNVRGECLTRQGAWLLLRTYARAAGIRPPISPSTLRHTLACALLAAGKSRVVVQTQLGHKAIQTTALYAKHRISA